MTPKTVESSGNPINRARTERALATSVLEVPRQGMQRTRRHETQNKVPLECVEQVRRLLHRRLHRYTSNLLPGKGLSCQIDVVYS
jgi:hypothetical protein